MLGSHPKGREGHLLDGCPTPKADINGISFFGTSIWRQDRCISEKRNAKKEREERKREKKRYTNPATFYGFKTRILPLSAITWLGTVPKACGRWWVLIKQQQLLALLERHNERTLNSIKKHKDQAQKQKRLDWEFAQAEGVSTGKQPSKQLQLCQCIKIPCFAKCNWRETSFSENYYSIMMQIHWNLTKIVSVEHLC